jgi:hypothetical protein
MQNEFLAMGISVHFVSVNTISGADSAGKLVDVCAFPLLQDTEDVNAWDLVQGKKDDMFILDANGNVLTLLPNGGDLSTNLSTEEGYNNVKYSLYEALGLDTPTDWPPADESAAQMDENRP